MSRFRAQVRQNDTLTGHFACDNIHVDGGGDLHLTLRHGPADHVTIARFQHGHWGSYTLDLTPEAEAAEPDADRCLDRGPAPQPNGMVHLIAPGRPGCVPSFVYRINPNDTVVLWPCLDPGAYPREVKQDETRRAEYSWHWPCKGDEPKAKPEVRPLTPVEITLTVQPGLSEQQLHAAISDAIRRQGLHRPMRTR